MNRLFHISLLALLLSPLTLSAVTFSNVRAENPIAKFDSDDSDIEVITLPNAVYAKCYAWWGVPILDVILGNGDVAYDTTDYFYYFTGSGVMLQIEVYSDDDTLYPGEYTIVDDDVSFLPGTFRAGHYGYSGFDRYDRNDGTYVCKVDDGAQCDTEFITFGRLTITRNDDSIYSFTLDLGKKIYISTVDLAPFGFSGIDTISADDKADTTIFNLQGVAMGKDLNSLPAGLYITNGKNVVKF